MVLYYAVNKIPINRKHEVNIRQGGCFRDIANNIVMTMFERWRVQVCLDSRGSDSYFILYVNKDGAATGADPAPPRGEHNIILLLFTPNSVLHVAKIFFYKKYLRSVEYICYCRLLAGESRVI